MKQIQDWLGHSDIGTTANIYAHLDYKSKITSAQAMETGLALPEGGSFTHIHLGRYGMMHKSYLKQFRPILYNSLVLSERLYEHCAEIEKAARMRMELMMPELAKDAGATEELKAADPLAWAGLMNTCKAQAEEIILTELIYN